MSNQKKSKKLKKKRKKKKPDIYKQQLKMANSRAHYKLKNNIIFHFAKLSGKDVCHICKNKIINQETVSVEHIVPWRYSENPQKLFFDPENIALAHISCNRNNRRYHLRHNVNTKSGFRGVHYDKGRKTPWKVIVTINKKRKEIGRFKTAEEGARAYDAYILKMRGDNAVTNEKLKLFEYEYTTQNCEECQGTGYIIKKIKLENK